jgi:hypothetical protein
MENEVTAQEIEEIALAYLYLTCWKVNITTGKKSTKQIIGSYLTNWKGLDWGVLDALQEQDFVNFGYKDKSLVLTPEGEFKAKEIIKRLLGKDFVVGAVEEVKG